MDDIPTPQGFSLEEVVMVRVVCQVCGAYSDPIPLTGHPVISVGEWARDHLAARHPERMT